MQTHKRELWDWSIIIVIILLGFLCLILAGSLALRLSPRWQLTADMGSNIDPNSDFLTNRPVEYIEPLDASILTPPVWLGLFQTPGASFPARTPLPTKTSIAGFTTTPAPATATTRTVTLTASPTGTGIIFYTPGSPTNTAKPAGTRTSTATATSTPTATSTGTATYTPTASYTPVPTNVDLSVTKTDGLNTTYTAGGTLTYTVIVTNNGPSAVIGATLSDAIPPQILNWAWVCTAQNGGATGCTPASNNAETFTDVFNLPNGASIEYTVTANVRVPASGSLSNTATVDVPVGYSDSNGSNDQAQDINYPAVDLQITKNNGVTTYTPGTSVVYNVTVTNSSTFMVDDATVADTFSAQISNATWSCTPDVGATCTANGTGNINDLVDIPAGLSVRYTITASTFPNAAGTLSNTITVTAPSGFTDIDTSNNSATDTDTCTSTEPDIGPPDNTWVELMPGNSIVIVLNPAIHADGDVGTPDFVYFERRATPISVDLDWVQVEISADGINWYQVFYWGDPTGNPDVNSNVDISDPFFRDNICATEVDNCNIPTILLHNNTGIAIDVDGYVPQIGYYPWIRITSPPGGDNDSSNIDSIQPYYP